VRAWIDGDEDAAAVAFPQLEVELLERAGLAGADVADRIARADVLRARMVEVGTDRDGRSTREPRFRGCASM